MSNILVTRNTSEQKKFEWMNSAQAHSKEQSSCSFHLAVRMYDFQSYHTGSNPVKNTPVPTRDDHPCLEFSKWVSNDLTVGSGHFIGENNVTYSFVNELHMLWRKNRNI